ALDPPTVLVSLGPNAAAAPYLDPGVQFGVSLLAAGQQGIASRYADTFPVGPSPFGEGDPPLVQDALAGLACTVDEVIRRGDQQLVLATVGAVVRGRDRAALVWRHRDYRSVE